MLMIMLEFIVMIIINNINLFQLLEKLIQFELYLDYFNQIKLNNLFLLLFS